MKFKISSVFAKDSPSSFIFYLEVLSILWNVLGLILWISMRSTLVNALRGFENVHAAVVLPSVHKYQWGQYVDSIFQVIYVVTNF